MARPRPEDPSPRQPGPCPLNFYCPPLLEEQVSAQAVKRARNARMVIAVVVLAALVLAGLLGAALGRSISRAIFREGLRRMSHRI